MTAIAGFVENGKVYMGGDSLITVGTRVYLTTQPKVFKLQDKFLIGFSGAGRYGDIVRFKFQPPVDNCENPWEYLCTSFTEELHKCLVEARGMGNNSNEPAESGSMLLLGYKGRLYTVYSTFSVEEQQAPYAAIGSGERFVFGALSALCDWESNFKTPIATELKIELALRAAANFSDSVRPPFVIESL